ncbi:MAG: saccharopine dehydrogenase NADP-binding domain-containing protein [Bacteroidia bacterium]|nr:saccharopine dehydrogenase NADP-binding domain-containing protein [Bacteroidia bacterium]
MSSVSLLESFGQINATLPDMPQKKIMLLGAGRVGRAIATDMAEAHEIVVADASASQLERLKRDNPKIQTKLADFLAIDTLKPEISEADLIITAVPGNLGYQVVSQITELGKPVVDISFFAEDPYDLESLAHKSGSIVIVDAGVAPGLSNFLLGYELTQQTIDTFICYVGGLPIERPWPFQYKAPFSPSDVIEEYTRPVRQRIGGQLVTKPPLSEVELIHIDGIGTLEAFNTDGLRTLLRTTKVPTLIEKTLRYPGHAEYMQVLAYTGFFSEKPIDINGLSVVPRQLASHLLGQAWDMKPDERDCLIMQLQMQSGRKTIQYTIIDYADEAKQVSAMARTTGYTCTAIASWLLAHPESLQPGVYAPEQIAAHSDCFSFVRDYLRERGIRINRH